MIVLRVNELEKELALPLVDPYNNEPSIDITKRYQGILGVFRVNELEKELALPPVVPYNSEPPIDITYRYHELWEY